MQDRFKFRAWHKEKQEMHNIDGLYAYDSEYTEGGEVFFKEDSSPKNSYYFPEEVELMQCTGLKDKNGKLIYEGDIVKLDDELNCIAQLHNKYDMDYGRIEFILIGGHPKCPTIYIPTVANESEVIGNVYENKELLNEVGN